MERPLIPGDVTCRQRGFTYIGLLVAVVILGLMLTIVARVWATTEQRAREAQLLWVGHAYRMAIASYVSLGHQYPQALEDLLTDERFPIPKRHLRQLYVDPMTGQADWALIMTPDGHGIMGVASSSQRAPIKQNGFDTIDMTFKGADCYCQWKFIYYGNRWNRSVVTGTVTTDPPASGPPGSASSPGSLGSFQPGHISTLGPGANSAIAPQGPSGAPFPADPPPPDGTGSN